MTLPDFLHMDANGEIRLTGNRIGLFHLVHYYGEGYSAEMLACQYPTLPLALIHKVIGFYLDHKNELDAYVAQYRVDLERQRAENPRRLDLTTLRQRLETMQHAEGT